MNNRLSLDAYEAPEVLGSFSAQDILGAADGLIGGGSTVQAA